MSLCRLTSFFVFGFPTDQFCLRNADNRAHRGNETLRRLWLNRLWWLHAGSLSHEQIQGKLRAHRFKGRRDLSCSRIASRAIATIPQE
jgi:hypothetical protein